MGFRARDGLSSSNIETWPTPIAVEIRSAEGSAVKRIGGRGITYGVMSKPLGHFIEQFEARSFSKSIGDQFVGVRSTLEHQPHQLLCTVDSGSMRVMPSEDGIDYEVDLCDTQACRDTWEMVHNGLICGSSVSFRCHRDSFTYSGGGLPVRHIEAAQLLECSPTALPAYGLGATDVAIRSLANQFGEDPADVLALANDGELRKLFERSGLAVSAPVTVPPTPLAVAQRSMSKPNKELSAMSAELESRRRKMEREDQTLTVEQAKVKVRMRELTMREEATAFPRDRYGNPIDWHLAQR